MLSTLILATLCSLIIILGVLITVAFLTLIERKVIASTQNRKGPNVVGTLGLLQPFADALKLIIKETIMPRNAKLFIFLVSPLISLFFALLA
jgi:NADH:ubiquinone oxidoreductase subunit H